MSITSVSDLESRFLQNVVEDGGCLIWQGACCNGHPSANIGGKWQLVRRVLYEQKRGPIPKGKVLRVTCGSTRCLNRDHWVVTTYKAIGKECGKAGLMSGRLRSARIAETKRSGPQAKISQQAAREIRDSEETGIVLAERYGVSQSTISKIRRGLVRREFAGNVWAGLAS